MQGSFGGLNSHLVHFNPQRNSHAKSSSPGLKISGKTEDGKLVVQGVFQITSSIGLPLEIILDTLTKQNMIIDWVDFIKTSLEKGSKLNTILYRVESAIGDCLGPLYKEEVMKRIKFLYDENK